jgi:hypothetical protein
MTVPLEISAIAMSGLAVIAVARLIPGTGLGLSTHWQPGP